MRLRPGLVGLLCAAFFGTSALAQPASPTDGIRAFENADFDTAIEILTPLADQGDATAQFYLGSIFNYVTFENSRPSKAVYWYQQAADQGDEQAQILAMQVGITTGLPPDYIINQLASLVETGDPAAARVTVAAMLSGFRSRREAVSTFKDNDRFMRTLALLDDSAESAFLAGRFYVMVWRGLFMPEVLKRPYPFEGTALQVAAGRAERWAISLLGDAASRGHPEAHRLLPEFVNDLPEHRRYLKRWLIGRDPFLWQLLDADRARTTDTGRFFEPSDNRIVDAWYAAKAAEGKTRIALALRWCAEEVEDEYRTCRGHAFTDDTKCRFPHKQAFTADDRATPVYAQCRKRLHMTPRVAEPAPAAPVTVSLERKGSLVQGIRAFESGSFMEAIEILRPIAEAGNAMAKYYLGQAVRELLQNAMNARDYER